MSWIVHNAEITTWAAEEAERIEFGVPKYHAVLCDPPYGIKFMNKEWDDPGGKEAFQTQVKQWGEALLPLLYPGAPVFMFAGTRMWHRLAAGMEDAGFHLFDTLMWIYGSGFPKAQDISKLIDQAQGNVREILGRAKGIVTKSSELAAPWAGHKTLQLKPAWEPILAFRAPNGGKTYAELALEYGSGALNVEGARIGTTTVGRYPANLVLDEESGAVLDKQSGETTSIGVAEFKQRTKYGWESSNANTEPQAGKQIGLGDTGGASRFFYCAKADRSERESGLESLPTVAFGQLGGAQQVLAEGKDEYLQEGHIGLNRIKQVRNNHPTVKPISLNLWLAKLLLPPPLGVPRRLLVPFSGVSSEMIGALAAGWDEVVGVEQSAEYVKLALLRLEHWERNGYQIETAAVREKTTEGQSALGEWIE